jgi:hypothetical protein
LQLPPEVYNSIRYREKEIFFNKLLELNLCHIFLTIKYILLCNKIRINVQYLGLPFISILFTGRDDSEQIIMKQFLPVNKKIKGKNNKI